MWPKSKTTKGEAIDYYARVAETLCAAPRRAAADPRPLPRRRRRPALLREAHPQGCAGLGSLGAGGDGHASARSTSSSATTSRPLVWLAQMGALELHPSLSKVDDDGVPDGRSPSTSTRGRRPPCSECCMVALRVRELFERRRTRELRQDVRLEGPPGLRAAERRRRRTSKRSRSPTRSPRRSRRRSRRWSSRG